MQKNILLIITGGIAAYKTLELIRNLRKDGYNVRCVATNAALEFVSSLSLSVLSDNKVYTDMWEERSEITHISLPAWADLIVIAPATANTIAKMANGIADDFTSSLLLAADSPVLVVPAMNTRMWNHPATQANVETLGKYGIHITETACGELACGKRGEGRMIEVDAIKDKIDGFFK